MPYGRRAPPSCCPLTYHAPTPTDIAIGIEALREAEMVLVPAHGGGTGLLGLRPPEAIAPAFGPQSATAHRQAAVHAGRSFEVLDCPSLARDIDTIADVADLANIVDAGSLGDATRAFLATHRLESLQTGLPYGDR